MFIMDLYLYNEVLILILQGGITMNKNKKIIQFLYSTYT